MSSRATGTSSLTQMYCCFRREPQPLCSMLKWICLDASVAEKSFTGIETRPNATVKLAMERAAMVPSPCACDAGLRHGVRVAQMQQHASRLGSRQRRFEALLAVQGVFPAIAGTGEAIGRATDREVEWVRA